MKQVDKPLMRNALIALACFGCAPTADIGSSAQDLVTVVDAVYSNIPVSPDHYATTSSLTTFDNSCGGSLNYFRTAAVWEEETFNTSDATTQLLIGNECGFNPPTINNGGAAQVITTSLVGTAPEWTAFFGPLTPMLWVGEPTLVPVLDPTQTGWLALVGIVSNPPRTFTGIAIALSKDGGQTWGVSLANPNGFTHVITPVPTVDNSIADLAVASGTTIDAPGGGYNSDLNTQTYDIYLTWWQNVLGVGQRFFQVVSYDLSGGYHHGPQINLNSFVTFNPDQSVGAPQNIINMSIVAGASLTPPPIRQPFVAVQWPNPTNTTFNPPNISCPSSAAFFGAVWSGAVSYNYGSTWMRLPPSHFLPGGSDDPKCVSVAKSYRNPQRSSLTFELNTATIIDAVAMPDPTLGPVPGTFIESNAFNMSAWEAPPPTVTPIFQSTHISGRAQQSQFLPVVTADRNFTPGHGNVAIAWVDSAEDTTNSDVPSGLYGVTSPVFTVATPGFSAVSRAWPVPPAPPAYIYDPVNLGADCLGRHNSLSVNALYWLTFAGDNTHVNGSGHPYLSMDTVSISPP